MNVKKISFWHPESYEIIISSDPQAEDPANIFLDSVRHVLSLTALVAQQAIDHEFIVTQSGKKMKITETSLQNHKIMHKDIQQLQPFHTYKLRTINVGSWIYQRLECAHAMYTMSVHQTPAVVPFEEFLQNIILEYLMKLTAEVRIRTMPKDEEEEETEN